MSSKENVEVAFRSNVKVRDLWYTLKLYKNVFVGSEAVDFLVYSGYASSRESAVRLGRKLATSETCGFQHVKGDHEFKDAYLFYKFIDDSKSRPKSSDDDDTVTYLAERRAALLGAHGFQPSEDRGYLTAEKRASVLSFREQVVASRQKFDEVSILTNEDEEDSVLVDAIKWDECLCSPFVSKIAPQEMRCLALVAHNHMKPAMKSFVETHHEILRKFRLTGTNTTMTMCRTIFGDDDSVVYGPTFTSGPLGGDAQLAALMCLEDVGGVIFFIDPLSPHPHSADIESLVRLANVWNIFLCVNPTSAIASMHVLRQALTEGRRGMFPSFFETLESPAVPEYKAGQKKALEQVVNGDK